MHKPDSGRSRLACIAVVVLSASCAGPASLTLTPTSTPGQTAEPTATQAPTATPMLLIAATPSPGPVVILPADVSGPQTIHLSLYPINDTMGSLMGCSNPGSCQGDFMVGYDPLFERATRKQVGTFAYECFLVDVGSTLYHCPDVTITLTGRGQIVFTEIIQHEPGKPPAIAPITGGSGEVPGAMGEVTTRVLPDRGDFVITITK